MLPNSRCLTLDVQTSIIWYPGVEKSCPISTSQLVFGIYRLVLTMCRVQYHTRVLSEKTLTLRVTREPNAKTTVFHLTTMSHGVRGIVNFV